MITLQNEEKKSVLMNKEEKKEKEME